jgi:hypothetical protein
MAVDAVPMVPADRPQRGECAVCNLFTRRDVGKRQIVEAFGVAEADTPDLFSHVDSRHWPMKPALIVRPRDDGGPGPGGGGSSTGRRGRGGNTSGLGCILLTR